MKGRDTDGIGADTRVLDPPSDSLRERCDAHSNELTSSGVQNVPWAWVTPICKRVDLVHLQWTARRTSAIPQKQTFLGSALGQRVND